MDSVTAAVFVGAGLAGMGLPIVLGYYSVKRFGVDLKFLGYAAAAYFIAQLMTLLPIILFNSVYTVTGVTVLVAAVSGLIVGGTEELVRYVTLKKYMADVRSWGRGVAFGAGWGSVQAVFIGLGLILMVFYAQGIRAMDTSALNATQAEVYETIVGEFSSIGLLDAIASFVTVVSRYAVQLAWSIAVVFSLKNGDRRLLGYAVASHVLVDGFGTYLLGFGEPYAAAFFGVAGAAATYYVTHVQESSPEPFQ